ncbi:MAG: hypothetical protein OXE44_01820 [Nitrospinae bacterium]|nr:hypothetical protein [Nitrospinota bacterium]
MSTYDEGIQAKLDSARCKLQQLRAEVRTFAETQHDKVEVIQTRDKSWHPKLSENFDTSPIEWSISIGEIAYHLRSSLDHLVYKLVCENGGKPTKQNTFPIVWEIDKVIHKVIYSEKGSEYVKQGREYIDEKALKGVGEQQKAKILLNQGFVAQEGEYGKFDIRTDPSEFSHLAYLCNVDKHRHLNLVKLQLVGLTNDYRRRENAANEKGASRPALRNIDFPIEACFHYEKSDDRPSNLGWSVDDVLTDIKLAVGHAIKYVSGRSSQPFAYLTNAEKYHLRRRCQQRLL